jgi:hypothetical protein
MKLKFFFNFILFQFFYLLDLVSIFLLLYILFEKNYEIRLFFSISFFNFFYLSDMVLIFLINLKKLKQ